MVNSTHYPYEVFECIKHLQVDWPPNLQNKPFLTEIGQSLHVILNPYQRRVQERKMKNLSTASWVGIEPVQPKFTSFRTASSKNAVNTIKPSFFRKVTPTKRQSNEEYVHQMEIETLSRVFQLELRLGRPPTMADLLAYFSKAELELVWDVILMYYPDIYSSIPEEEVEVEENIYSRTTKFPKAIGGGRRGDWR